MLKNWQKSANLIENKKNLRIGLEVLITSNYMEKFYI